MRTPRVFVAALTAAAALGAAHALAASHGAAAPARLMRQAARSLAARHHSERAGWAWRSVIQAPHFQTDRDVGAASVGMGFLAMYEATRDGNYLADARHAADWLLSVAQRSGGGLRWPDLSDGGRPSPINFTSFDDGAPGIADFLWRLGAATRDARYERAALAGMHWLASRAEAAGGGACPASECRWQYFQSTAAPGTTVPSPTGTLEADQTAGPEYFTGIGQGIAGIVYAFDVFAERTRDTHYERYALAGARYLEHQITPAGALPEQPGTTGYDTGFLSGATGDAFVFLRLYQHTGQARWLEDARRLLAWVRRQGARQAKGVAWPIEIDPAETDESERAAEALLASGIEEGAAGIGWVELQDFELTGDPAALAEARHAADWLVATARHERGGYAWAEDYRGPSTSTSLDNGAAGIGWFLHDLARTTGVPAYARAARGAATWLRAVSSRDGRGALWYEHRSGGRWQLRGEPSWHWGSAGIGAFLARMSGGPLDMPGEEPALCVSPHHCP